MTLLDYLRAAPGAQLHVHLEGAIGSYTRQSLAKHNGLDLPEGEDAPGGRSRRRDFDQFALRVLNTERIAGRAR